jgi:hypothetical protein
MRGLSPFESGEIPRFFYVDQRLRLRRIPVGHQIRPLSGQPAPRADVKRVEFVKAHPSRLGAMVWINPHNETVTPALEKCIEENRKYIFGLESSILSRAASASPRKKLEPYFALMPKNTISRCLVHTAQDKYSDVLFPRSRGRGKHPELKFVAAHMQLRQRQPKPLSRSSKAIENVYGDTAWVDMRDREKSPHWTSARNESCSAPTTRSMGSRYPGNNPMYESYYKNKVKLPGKLYHNLMYRNAINLYKLPVK